MGKRAAERLVPPLQPAVVFDLRGFPLNEWTPRLRNAFIFGLESGMPRRCHFAVSEAYPIDGRHKRVHGTLEQALEAARLDELRRERSTEKQAKLDLSRVILRGGIDSVRFGMQQDEVRELMGEADQFDTTFLYYDIPDLTLEFASEYPQPPRLTEIWTDTPDKLRMLGMSVTELKLTRAIKALSSAGIKHRGWKRFDGQDEHYFEYGLTLENVAETIERVRWTILDDDGLISAEAPIG